MCWGFKKKKDKRVTSKIEDNRHQGTNRDLEFLNNILERDVQYVKILQHYAKHHAFLDWTQLAFKSVFFVLVCFVFAYVACYSIKSIYVLASKENLALADIATAIASFGSILSIIMVLPSKIADNLFPSNDEDNMEFIKAMQGFDLAQRPVSGDESFAVQMPPANPTPADPANGSVESDELE